MAKKVTEKKFEKHGMFGTPLYHIWAGMVSVSIRTGCVIDKEWRMSFASFKEYAVRSGYRDGMRKKKLDGAKGYIPGNVIFEDPELFAYRRTRLYGIWRGMRTRCNDPKLDAYKYYGARGIAVCDEWDNSFEAFRDFALSHGYRDDLSIERIDSNGNYEPSNVRFATAKEQAANTRRNHWITINGVTKMQLEWAHIAGISHQCLQQRLKRGVTGEALIAPKGAIHKKKNNVRNVTKVTINGVTRTYTEWGNVSGIKQGTLRGRVNNGWPEDMLLAPTRFFNQQAV